MTWFISSKNLKSDEALVAIQGIEYGHQYRRHADLIKSLRKSKPRLVGKMRKIVAFENSSRFLVV